MTTMRLEHGPCDPREVEMTVTVNATEVRIRPMPFQLEDVYLVTDRFIDEGRVTHASGTYRYTTGSRPQRQAYQRALTRLGLGRAFALKTQAQAARHVS